MFHRYICFWHLGYYELCARDLERNLRLFSFVREHARDDRDRLRFDQWRPYVTMMHARAVATPLVELEQWDAAAGVLDAGIRGIEQFLEEYNQANQASQVGELTFLRRWKEEILTKIKSDEPETVVETVTAPTSVNRPRELQVMKSNPQFTKSVYEDAAMLPDQ